MLSWPTYHILGLGFPVNFTVTVCCQLVFMQKAGKFPFTSETTPPAVPGQAPTAALTSVAPATGCPSENSVATSVPAGKLTLTGELLENFKSIELPLSGSTPHSLKFPPGSVLVVSSVVPSSANVVTVRFGTPALLTESHAW